MTGRVFDEFRRITERQQRIALARQEAAQRFQYGGIVIHQTNNGSGNRHAVTVAGDGLSGYGTLVLMKHRTGFIPGAAADQRGSGRGARP